jgi:phosphomethylpyrimidine synthase
VIPRNRKRGDIRPVAIGEGLRVKINANVGTSRDRADIEVELEKTRVAVAAGADAVMDLSTGGPIDGIRRAILAECPVPVGTVPVYQAAADAASRGKSFVELSAGDFFDGILKQAEDGVDFMTVHCGVTREALARLVREGRRLDIVSRGGSLLAEWMEHNGRENPFFEQYDRLLEICREYDITISLGDGLRPGCLADATDRAQVHELMTLGELTERAWKRDVQVMVEGPGHVPLHQIAANVQLQKRLCHGAPFYVLGPLVTDIAPGYDHITSAIGGAIAAWNGADFLCYVTPSEHLRLPTVEDVKTGVIASRIAAHAADIARGIPGAIDRDNRMADARRKLDWKAQIELSVDPETARALRGGSLPTVDEAVCTMCADLCAIKTSQKAIRRG